MEIICKSNLDLEGEQWPTSLPALPRVGDRINSGTEWINGFRLSLEVVSVEWRYWGGSEWRPFIELDLPRSIWKTRSIRDFYKWYIPRTGRPVDALFDRQKQGSK